MRKSRNRTFRSGHHSSQQNFERGCVYPAQTEWRSEPVQYSSFLAIGSHPPSAPSFCPFSDSRKSTSFQAICFVVRIAIPLIGAGSRSLWKGRDIKLGTSFSRAGAPLQ